MTNGDKRPLQETMATQASLRGTTSISRGAAYERQQTQIPTPKVYEPVKTTEEQKYIEKIPKRYISNRKISRAWYKLSSKAKASTLKHTDSKNLVSFDRVKTVVRKEGEIIKEQRTQVEEQAQEALVSSGSTLLPKRVPFTSRKERVYRESVKEEVGKFVGGFETQVARLAPLYGKPEYVTKAKVEAEENIQSEISKLTDKIKRYEEKIENYKLKERSTGKDYGDSIDNIKDRIDILEKERRGWERGLKKETPSLIKEYFTGYTEKYAEAKGRQEDIKQRINEAIKEHSSELKSLQASTSSTEYAKKYAALPEILKRTVTTPGQVADYFEQAKFNFNNYKQQLQDAGFKLNLGNQGQIVSMSHPDTTGELVFSSLDNYNKEVTRIQALSPKERIETRENLLPNQAPLKVKVYYDPKTGKTFETPEEMENYMNKNRLPYSTEKGGETSLVRVTDIAARKETPSLFEYQGLKEVIVKPIPTTISRIISKLQQPGLVNQSKVRILGIPSETTTIKLPIATEKAKERTEKIISGAKTVFNYPLKVSYMTAGAFAPQLIPYLWKFQKVGIIPKEVSVSELTEELKVQERKIPFAGPAIAGVTDLLVPKTLGEAALMAGGVKVLSKIPKAAMFAIDIGTLGGGLYSYKKAETPEEKERALGLSVLGGAGFLYTSAPYAKAGFRYAAGKAKIPGYRLITEDPLRNVRFIKVPGIAAKEEVYQVEMKGASLKLLERQMSGKPIPKEERFFYESFVKTKRPEMELALIEKGHAAPELNVMLLQRIREALPVVQSSNMKIPIVTKEQQVILNVVRRNGDILGGSFAQKIVLPESRMFKDIDIASRNPERSAKEVIRLLGKDYTYKTNSFGTYTIYNKRTGKELADFVPFSRYKDVRPFLGLGPIPTLNVEGYKVLPSKTLLLKKFETLIKVPEKKPKTLLDISLLTGKKYSPETLKVPKKIAYGYSFEEQAKYGGTEGLMSSSAKSLFKFLRPKVTIGKGVPETEPLAGLLWTTPFQLSSGQPQARVSRLFGGGSSIWEIQRGAVGLREKPQIVITNSKIVDILKDPRLPSELKVAYSKALAAGEGSPEYYEFFKIYKSYQRGEKGPIITEAFPFGRPTGELEVTYQLGNIIVKDKLLAKTIIKAPTTKIKTFSDKDTALTYMTKAKTIGRSSIRRVGDKWEVTVFTETLLPKPVDIISANVRAPKTEAEKKIALDLRKLMTKQMSKEEAITFLDKASKDTGIDYYSALGFSRREVMYEPISPVSTLTATITSKKLLEKKYTKEVTRKVIPERVIPRISRLEVFRKVPGVIRRPETKREDRFSIMRTPKLERPIRIERPIREVRSLEIPRVPRLIREERTSRITRITRAPRIIRLIREEHLPRESKRTKESKVEKEKKEVPEKRKRSFLLTPTIAQKLYRTKRAKPLLLSQVTGFEVLRK